MHPSRGCREVCRDIATLVGLRLVVDHSDEYCGVIRQVLVPCDNDPSMGILKIDALDGWIVEAMEVLHCRDDRLGAIVRKDLNPHWQPCLVQGGIVDDQLKGHVFGWRVTWTACKTMTLQERCSGDIILIMGFLYGSKAGVGSTGCVVVIMRGLCDRSGCWLMRPSRVW